MRLKLTLPKFHLDQLREFNGAIAVELETVCSDDEEIEFLIREGKDGDILVLDNIYKPY